MKNNMEIDEAIKRLKLMTEVGQDKNNEALEMAITALNGVMNLKTSADNPYMFNEVKE